METEWAAHAFHADFTVLNLKLRPYSCGHEILLSLIGSPFAVEGKVELKDLVLAVIICSQDFKSGIKLVYQPRKVELFCRVWKWFLSLTRCKLDVEFDRFRDYLIAGRWTPETADISIRPGWETRRLIAPRVYRLIPMICERLGMTEAQALDFPMARAQAYLAAKCDQDGTIDLNGGETENATLKHLADLEARAAKGENVWGF